MQDVCISTNALDESAKFIIEHPKLFVQINGYADKSECAHYDCKELSERRAIVVFNWLRSHGVSAVRLGYSGFGAGEALDFSETESQRQRNRRVEFDAEWREDIGPSQ